MPWSVRDSSSKTRDTASCKSSLSWESRDDPALPVYRISRRRRSLSCPRVTVLTIGMQSSYHASGVLRTLRRSLCPYTHRGLNMFRGVAVNLLGIHSFGGDGIDGCAGR